MGDFDDDCFDLPLEDELEMLQAIYTPDELEIINDGLEISCKFKRVWGTAKLLFDAEEYPAKSPEFVLAKTRGLLEQQCTDLENQVKKIMQDNFPHNCLVQVLETVVESFRSYDDVGECSICLQPIHFNVSSEGFCSPICWHQFHIDCLVAWWKQKDTARLEDASTKDVQQAREGELKSLESRIATQDQLLSEASQKQSALRSQKAHARALIEILNAGGELEPEEEGDKVPTKASLSAEIKGANRGLAELEKKFAVITARKVKLQGELDSVTAKITEAMNSEKLHGVDCPVCRCHIPYSSIKEFLYTSLERMGLDLNSEAHKEKSVLPSLWEQEQTEISNMNNAQVFEKCMSQMDADVQENLLRMRNKMKLELEKRNAKLESLQQISENPPEVPQTTTAWNVVSR